MEQQVRVLFIVNPRSGGGAGTALIGALREALDGTRTLGEVRMIGDLPFLELMEEARSFPYVIVAGGDGTVASVLAELRGSSVAVGIYPLGTGNDLAWQCGIRNFFQKKSLNSALAEFIRLPVLPLTLWSVRWGAEQQNERIFSNYFSLGFDAHAVTLFDERRRRSNLKARRSVWGNRLAYSAAAVECLKYNLPKTSITEMELARTPPIELNNCRTLIFANIRTIMGLGYSNNISNPFDDKIEALAVTSIVGYGSMIIGSRGIGIRVIGSARKWEAHVSTPTALQVDGEPIDPAVSGVLQVSPSQSVQVVCGAKETALRKWG